MTNLRADRLFFYIFLLVVTLATVILIRPYIGAVVLAVTFAVVLRPMHDFFRRRVGGRNGIATALTLVTTIVGIVIPVLIGLLLLFDSFAALSGDVIDALQEEESVWLTRTAQLDAWLESTGLAEQLQLDEQEVSRTVRDWIVEVGLFFAQWLTSLGLSTFKLIVPLIVFISLLGTLLTNNQHALRLVKQLSPLDDAINQLFLDRLNIMTRAMMRGIVIIAVLQGAVTGLMMALGSTPHIIPLTLVAMLFSILPFGAALIAVPVGLMHLMLNHLWQGALIIVASVTLVASLDNQVRPLLVSKDAYLNRAFVLLSVFSGIALFGFMGVVYGPLIMILFTTTLEVYLRYYHPGPPEVTVAAVAADERAGDKGAGTGAT